MNQYEAMFIMKPDLSEEERKTLFAQMAELIAKYKGEVTAASVWAEKRKLFFPLKKQKEGLYYLMNFLLPGGGIAELRHAYTLNENILRVLITRVGQ